MFADGLKDLIERETFLPLLAVSRKVVETRPVKTQKPCKAVRIQFALQHVKSMPLELLVGQIGRERSWFLPLVPR